MPESRTTVFQYLPLGLVSVLLLGLVATWSWYEHAQARAQAEGELQHTGHMISAALQGSVSSQVRRGCFQHDRVVAILENAAVASGLRYMSAARQMQQLRATSKAAI